MPFAPNSFLLGTKSILASNGTERKITVLRFVETWLLTERIVVFVRIHLEFW